MNLFDNIMKYQYNLYSKIYIYKEFNYTNKMSKSRG